MKKLCALTLAAILITTLLGACDTTPAQTSTAASIGGTSSSASTPEEGGDELGMPIVTDGSVTLTWWQGFHPAHLNTVKSLNEVAAFVELQALTGIKLEFQSPPSGQEDDAFSTMVAARNIPDIMVYDISKYPGGATKAVKDKVIMDITSLIENNAPNVNSFFDKWPETRKDAKTDDGMYYMFPSFNDPNFMTTAGLMLRRDWLAEYGLEVPETIDEWYDVLTTFKANGVEYPFTMEHNYIRLHNYFVCAYDTTMDFWRDADTQQAKFGPVEPGYKEFLATMQKWYAEGLIDADFPTQSRQMLDAKMLNDQAGSTGGFFGSAAGMWLGQKKDSDFDLVFAPYPTLEKGDIAHFSNWQWPLYTGGGLLSADNKYPVETARMLDYIYSHDGSMLMNFGIEGDSYEMIDGYPTLTEKILTYDGSLQEALAPYTPLSGGSIFYQEEAWFDQLVLQYEAQREGNAIFRKLESGKWLMPPRLSFTDNEMRVVSQYYNEIKTYVDEMFVKFTLGQEPIDNYDNFVRTLESMNYKEVLAAYQAALDRYNER